MASPMIQSTVGRTWMFGGRKKAPIRIAKGTGKGADLAGLKVNEPKWTFGSQVKNFFEPGRKAKKIAEWQAREAATQASSTVQKQIESKHHKPEFAQRSNADKSGVSKHVTSAKTADLPKPSVQPSTECSSRVSQLEERAQALTEAQFRVPFRDDRTSPQKWIDEHKQTLRPQAQKMKDQLAATVGSRELSSLSNDELHDIAAAVWSVVIPGLHANYCTAIPEASKSLVNELLHAVASNPLFDGLDKANRKDAIKAMFYFAYFNRGFQALLCERSDRMKELEAIRPKQRTAEQKAELAKEAQLALLMARVAAFGAAACGLVLETKPMSICPSKEAIASGTAFYKALSSEALSRAGISREGPYVRKRAGRPGKEGGVSFSFTGNKGAIRAGVPDATTPGTLITDWKSPFSGIRKRFEEGFSFVFGPKKKLAEEGTPGKPNSDFMAYQGRVQPGLPNASAEDLQEQRSNPEQRFHQGSDDGASSGFHPLTPGLTPPSSKDSLLEDISLNDLDPVVDTPARDAGEGSTSSAKQADVPVNAKNGAVDSSAQDSHAWDLHGNHADLTKVEEALQEASEPTVPGTRYEADFDAETRDSFKAVVKAFFAKNGDVDYPAGLEWFASGRLNAYAHALCASLPGETSDPKPNVRWKFSYDVEREVIVANFHVQPSSIRSLEGGFEFSTDSEDWKALDVSVRRTAAPSEKPISAAPVSVLSPLEDEESSSTEEPTSSDEKPVQNAAIARGKFVGAKPVRKNIAEAAELSQQRRKILTRTKQETLKKDPVLKRVREKAHAGKEISVRAASHVREAMKSELERDAEFRYGDGSSENQLKLAAMYRKAEKRCRKVLHSCIPQACRDGVRPSDATAFLNSAASVLPIRYVSRMEEFESQLRMSYRRPISLRHYASGVLAGHKAILKGESEFATDESMWTTSISLAKAYVDACDKCGQQSLSRWLVSVIDVQKAAKERARLISAKQWIQSFEDEYQGKCEQVGVTPNWVEGISINLTEALSHAIGCEKAIGVGVSLGLIAKKVN